MTTTQTPVALPFVVRYSLGYGTVEYGRYRTKRGAERVMKNLFTRLSLNNENDLPVSVEWERVD